MLRCILRCLAVLIFAPAGADGAVYRVPSEYGTINQGIDAASAGDTVLVAPGTYPDFEVRSGGGGPVSACAFLKDGVVLLSEAGPEVTAIDRMGVDTVEPAVTISTFGLVGQGTVVEGFRITGNPVGNTAVNARQFGASAFLTFRSCHFEDLDGGASTGAVRSVGASLRFESCEFRRCSGGHGAINFDEGDLAIVGCLFEECSTTSTGVGAVIAGNPTPQFPQRACEVVDTTFRANHGWGAGALAVANFGAGSVVERCSFEDNVAENAAGALIIGGAGEHVVRRNLFVRNRADGAGPNRVAGSIYAGQIFVIEENTIVDSHHGQEASGGAAIFVASDLSTPGVIRNNVITGSTGGEAIGVALGTIATSCNVFWANAEGEADGFMLDPTDLIADPQFCDPASDNYHVSQSSPCVPENNPNCGPIGAFGVGCGLISVTPMSWGQIKGLYQLSEE